MSKKSYIPKISVIIPTHNNDDTILENIQSILNQSYPKEKLEVIYINDGSTDKTTEILNQYKNKFKIFYQQNRGVAAARNLGLKNAKGQVIAFTDADCFPDINWLINLIKRYSPKDESIGAIGGSLPNAKAENILEKYLAETNPDKQSHINDPSPYLLTANVAYPRKILEKIGYFDEHLLSGEDADISWRISRAGYKLIYVPEAVVYFLNRNSYRGLIDQAFRDGRGWARLEKKYKIKDNKSRKIIFNNFNILVNLDKKFKDKRTSNISIIRRIIYYFITELSIFLGLIYEHYLAKNESWKMLNRQAPFIELLINIKHFFLRPFKYQTEFNYWKTAFEDQHHQYYWQNDEKSLKMIFQVYCDELNINKNSFKNKVVIDVGCGPMGSLHYFNAKMKFGVDILANQYNQEFNTQKHDMIYLNCHSHKIPLVDEFADAVISRNALDHVNNFEKTINEIYRILKMEGEILLSLSLRPFSLITEPQILTRQRMKKALMGKFHYKITKELKRNNNSRDHEIIVIKGKKIAQNQ